MSVLLYPGSAAFKPLLRKGAPLTGTFLTLGSPACVELASRAGFDCLLLDLEHGLCGDDTALLPSLMAAAGASTCVPIVRVPCLDAARFKRALDLGACGIMVPCVETAEDASDAVRAMRYPPHGVRGVSRNTRANGYGADFDDYFNTANERLTLMLQIETAAGVAHAGEIAAVDGVDVLFVGPTDLAASLVCGNPSVLPFCHASAVAARRTVVAAARSAGIAAGILVSTSEHIAVVRDEGFQLIMYGSDQAAVAAGLRGFAAALK